MLLPYWHTYIQITFFLKNFLIFKNSKHLLKLSLIFEMLNLKSPIESPIWDIESPIESEKEPAASANLSRNTCHFVNAISILEKLNQHLKPFLCNKYQIKKIGKFCQLKKNTFAAATLPTNGKDQSPFLVVNKFEDILSQEM